MKEPLRIPFDGAGNQLGFDGYYWRDLEWRENYTFTAPLTLTGIGKGRSSVKGFFKDPDGHKYEMFLSDFTSLLMSDSFSCGVATGTWTFRKAGANYGICLAKEAAKVD